MTFKSSIGRVLIARLPFNRKAFDFLRFELNAMTTRALYRMSPRVRARRTKLRKEQDLNLNIGSGGRGHDGWVNIDIGRAHKDQTIPWDIRYGLPFRDGQVARIFAEHVIEHIDFFEDVPRLFCDAHRVLKEGGRIRIVVPDGARYLRAYIDDDDEQFAALGFPVLPDDMPTRMALVNLVFHQHGEHKFAYDFETMKHALLAAGFSRVRQTSFRSSEDDKLALDRDQHRLYSLYVEAQK